MAVSSHSRTASCDHTSLASCDHSSPVPVDLNVDRDTTLLNIPTTTSTKRHRVFTFLRGMIALKPKAGGSSHDTVTNQNPEHCGWLQKMHEGQKDKEQKNRYFLLTQHGLKYFKNDDCKELMGMLPLLHISVVQPLESLKFKFVSARYSTPYLMTCSSSSTERDEWVAAIQKQIDVQSQCFFATQTNV